MKCGYEVYLIHYAPVFQHFSFHSSFQIRSNTSLIARGGGGGPLNYTAVHTRDHRFFEPTLIKQVLSIGQIYTLFKYFRVLFWQFCPLNKYNP